MKNGTKFHDITDILPLKLISGTVGQSGKNFRSLGFAPMSECWSYLLQMSTSSSNTNSTATAKSIENGHGSCHVQSPRSLHSTLMTANSVLLDSKSGSSSYHQSLRVLHCLLAPESTNQPYSTSSMAAARAALHPTLCYLCCYSCSFDSSLPPGMASNSVDFTPGTRHANFES